MNLANYEMISFLHWENSILPHSVLAGLLFKSHRIVNMMMDSWQPLTQYIHDKNLQKLISDSTKNSKWGEVLFDNHGDWKDSKLVN